MFITRSSLCASPNIAQKKKKSAEFSVNALHVHSMDLLSHYVSSEDNETCGSEDSPSAEKVLKENQPRGVYLITYSEGDIIVILTRQAFLNMVLEAVRATDGFEVQWVCAQGKASIRPK